MGEKRVIEQVASNEVHNDDWFLKDSPTQDTSKISATNLKAILGADGTLALEEIANAIAEEYDSTHTYYNTGLVFHEGVLYQCTASSVTGTWDSTKWNAVDIKDLLDNVSTNISYLWNVINNTIADNYDTSSTYDTGDYVIYSLKLYRCKADSVTGAWDSSKWDEVNIPEYIDYVLENAGIVKDVKVDGTSVVNEQGEAEIEIPVKDVQVKTTGDYETVVENKIAKIDLSNKADKDGMYDELYAGNLLSDNTEIDNAPYTYRPSPSGKSCVDLSVVGGTVAWNQIVENGNFASTSGWLVQNSSISVSDNVATVTSNTSYTEANIVRINIGIVKDHIYLLSSEAKSDSEVLYKYSIYGAGSGTQVFSLGNLTNNFAKYQKLVKADGDKGNFYLSVTKSQASDLVVMNYKNVNIIDFTQAFGSTIADAVYTMEEAEAGSGIAWLKGYGFLTKDYYAYDSGSLQSVNVASRKIIGKNLLNAISDNFIYGGESPTGKVVIENNGLTLSTSLNGTYGFVLPVIGGKTYKIALNKLEGGTHYCRFRTYSSKPTSFDDAYIDTYESAALGVGRTEFTRTMPSNANYLFVGIYRSYSTAGASITDMLVTLGEDTNFELYTSTTYPLDSDLTLRGIPKLDANNNLYYDGDIYESDGSVTRKYGVVDLGTLSWSYNNIQKFFFANLDDIKLTTKNLICDRYIYVEKSWTTMQNGEFGKVENSNQIRFHNDNYETSADFKTAMSGVQLVYKLATPTSETADAYENPQLAGSTEEFVDAGTSASTPTRDVDIPVGQDSKYHTDLKAKLEELAKIPDVPSSNGTYTLKATRSASGIAYSWVSG